MAELSVLIPARNERWLGRTIEDVLTHAKADTDVIVVLDGAWPEEPIPQHPRVTMVYVPTPIGQRAATNLAARLSTAPYILKLDAHCAVADGFDVELLTTAKTLGPDVTQIPSQYNLHVFDWQCESCGSRTYQGPTPLTCGQCHTDGPFVRWMVWERRTRRKTEFWRFDQDLKFQYWSEYKHRPEAQGEIVDVMTSLGACFFMARARFWQLGGMDEQAGSWGQFGVEIALKSWLSGGRHVVNRRTWFAHLFRTQGGDFGFPYPLSGRHVERTREYSRQTWMHNAWPGQVKPLSWLLEKFAPVPGWTDEAIQAVAPAKAPSKGLVYYSDCRGDATILDAVRTQLTRSVNGHRIVSATLQPVDFGTNIVVPMARGYLAMFRQILAGLEALDTEIAFVVEHDVLYHESHWTFMPPRDDCYYYNLNCWKVDAATGRAVTYETKQTSQLCANRQLLINHYRTRIALVERDGFSRRMGFEPGSHHRKERIDEIPSATWRSEVPNIDIRHDWNLTASRWSTYQFRDQRHCRGWTEGDGVPGWGVTRGRFSEFLREHGL